MPMNMLTAVAANNDIWLLPLKASLPKIRIVANNRATNMITGTSEISGDGDFFILFSSYYLSSDNV